MKQRDQMVGVLELHAVALGSNPALASIQPFVFSFLTYAACVAITYPLSF